MKNLIIFKILWMFLIFFSINVQARRIPNFEITKYNIEKYSHRPYIKLAESKEYNSFGNPHYHKRGHFHKVFKKRKNINKCIKKRHYVPNHSKVYGEREYYEFNNTPNKKPRFRN